MENIKQVLQGMAKRWHLTGHEDQEKYILTPEEEDKAIAWAIEQAQNHYRVRFSRWLPESAIDAAIACIDWNSKVNQADVLYKANSAKNYQIWQEQQRQLKKEQDEKKLQDLKSYWTAKTIFALMKQVSRDVHKTDLFLNDHTNYLIKVCCFFLAKDQRFETELGFDLNKGLLLRGVSGLGKTYVFECVAKNPLNPVQMFSMIKISKVVKKEGECNLPDHGLIYLDDVGTEEPVVNNYGTAINWFKEFIEIYYSENRPFNKLIVSTNNNFDQWEAKYGFRVRSRANDIFNIIDLKGVDLRRIKK